MVAERKELLVALDWTEFDDDDYVSLCAYVITRHGRVTPLIWKTHRKSEMEGHRTQWEHDLVTQLHAATASDVGITLIADRGFGDQKLYELLTLYGWDYVIRFRGIILVEDEKGEERAANDWVRPGGRAFMIRNAKVTADKAAVPAVVLYPSANGSPDLSSRRPQDPRGSRAWARGGRGKTGQLWSRSSTSPQTRLPGSVPSIGFAPPL